MPVIQSQSIQSVSSNAVSITLSKPSGTVDGDLLLAFISKDDDDAISNPDTTWTTEQALDGGNNTNHFHCSYKIAASEGSTWAWTGDSEEWCGVIFRIDGHDSSTPINTSGAAWSSGGPTTAPQSPSISTTVSGCMIFAGFGCDDDDTPFGVDGSLNQEWNHVSSTGTGTCGSAGGQLTKADDGATGTFDFTMNASENWVTFTVAVAPPSAGDQTVSPSSIPSDETFGSPTVVAGVVTITTNSIPSAETFGSLTISLTVSTNSISSAEVAGNPTILVGVVTITTNSIPSADAIGSHQVNLVVTANSITSAETFGTAAILFDQTVTTNSVPSAEASGNPTVTVATSDQTITTNSVPSAEAFGTLTITNATIVSPSGIPVPGGTTKLVSDTFTVDSDTNLDAHTPTPTGDGWTEEERTGTRFQRIQAVDDYSESDSVESSDRHLYTVQPNPVGAEYDIEAKITTTGGITDIFPWFLLARLTDVSNYYSAGSYAASASADKKIFKKVGGTPAELASGDSGLSSGDVFKFEVRDADKKLYKNGGEELSTSNNELTSSGRVGFGLGNTWNSSDGIAGYWLTDDFEVDEIGAAFGTPTIILSVKPNSITSAETVGNPTVLLEVGDQTVSPSGIPSSETFGTTVVLAGPVTITTNSISSAEAFGTTAVIQLTLISPSGIPIPGGTTKLVSDTFTVGTHTNLDIHIPTPTGDGWTEEERTGARYQNIQADEDYSKSTGDESSDRHIYSVQPNPLVVEYDVKAELVGVTTFGAAPWFLIGRFTDISNYYSTGTYFAAAAADKKIFKTVSGSPTELASGDSGITANDVLMFEIRDATKKLYKNGGEELSTSNNELTSSGRVGFGLGNAWTGSDWIDVLWKTDNFEVDEVTSTFGTPTIFIPIKPNSIISAEVVGNPTVLLVVGDQTVSPSSIISDEAFGSLTIGLTVEPNSIASVEAFGTTIISASIDIITNSITSAEAFGTQQVNLTIRLTGTASAETVGNPTITLAAGDQTVTASSIPSAEAIGSLTIRITVEPNSIISTEIFGTHTVATVAILQTSSITSAEVFGTQQVNLSVTVNGITSAEVFGTHTVTNAAIVSPSQIPSAETFGIHTVTAGVATVVTNSIPSAEAIGSLATGLSVSTNSIPSAEVFGSHTLSLTIEPNSIDSSEAFGTTSVVAGIIILLVSSIISAEAFGTHSISTRTLTPNAIISDETFGNPIVVLAGGTQTLAPNAISSEEAFGTMTVLAGVAIITANSIPSAEAFGTYTLSLTVDTNSISSSETFGSHVLTSVSTIQPSQISSAEAFGTYRLSITVEPNSITSAETLGNPTVLAGTITLTTDSITSAEAFGSLTIGLNISPNVITSEEAFGTAVILSDQVVTVNSIPSEEVFGSILILLAGGSQTVTTNSIPSAEVIGSLTTGLSVSTNSIASAEAFGNPTVTVVSTVTPSSISSTEAFGQAQINLFVAVNAISTAELVSSPTVDTNANVSPLTIPSQESVSSPKLNLFVAVNSIASAEAFGNVNIVGQDQILYPSSVLSLEAFGLLTISASSSKRWLIIKDIMNTLEDITVVNGYTNTINFVTDEPVDYDEIEDAQIPFAIVDDIQNSDETIVPLTNIHVDCDFVLNIIVVFKATSNLSKNIDSLIKDMKKALYLDTTRNGNAEFTALQNISMDKTEKKDVVAVNFNTLFEYTRTYQEA